MAKVRTSTTDAPDRKGFVFEWRGLSRDRQMRATTTSTAAKMQRSRPHPNKSPVTFMPRRMEVKNSQISENSAAASKIEAKMADILADEVGFP